MMVEWFLYEPQHQEQGSAQTRAPTGQAYGSKHGGSSHEGGSGAPGTYPSGTRSRTFRPPAGNWKRLRRTSQRTVSVHRSWSLALRREGTAAMILDTSAIIAILRNETEAPVFAKAVEEAVHRRISAVNYVEAAAVIDGSRDPIASRRFDEIGKASCRGRGEWRVFLVCVVGGGRGEAAPRALPGGILGRGARRPGGPPRPDREPPIR